MYAFEYHRPASVAAAIDLLGKLGEGKLMAGGQTLIPTLKQRLAQPSDLIDLGAIAELKGIREDGDTIVIGSMTPHAEVAFNDLVKRRIPSLAGLAQGIGDIQVRNRGTIGGSIANADPAADYPAALVALNATVRTNSRMVIADDFFTGMFETALDPNEIVIDVRFPVPEKAAYAKFPNPASRYAMVGVFVARTGGTVRVAVTGAGPSVFRVPDMETALAQNFAPSAIDGVTIDPDGLNSDIHAGNDYRAHLVTVMAKRAVTACG